MRKMPPAELGRGQHSSSAFPQRTTMDCYQAFPHEVKASCPLQPRKSIDLEKVKEGLAAGPVGGRRCRPAPEQLRSWHEARSDREIARNCALLWERSESKAVGA
jgi:hypothetical protein